MLGLGDVGEWMKKAPSQAALAAKRKREHEEALERMNERELKEAAYKAGGEHSLPWRLILRIKTN